MRTKNDAARLVRFIGGIVLLASVLGLAERAWAAQPEWARQADRGVRERQRLEAWNRFANVLGQRELPRLDALFGGFAYRLPPPGAVIEDGELLANVRYPGLVVRYETGSREPTAESPVWEGPARWPAPFQRQPGPRVRDSRPGSGWDSRSRSRPRRRSRRPAPGS